MFGLRHRATRRGEYGLGRRQEGRTERGKQVGGPAAQEKPIGVPVRLYVKKTAAFWPGEKEVARKVPDSRAAAHPRASTRLFPASQRHANGRRTG